MTPQHRTNPERLPYNSRNHVDRPDDFSSFGCVIRTSQDPETSRPVLQVLRQTFWDLEQALEFRDDCFRCETLPILVKKAPEL